MNKLLVYPSGCYVKEGNSVKPENLSQCSDCLRASRPRSQCKAVPSGPARGLRNTKTPTRQRRTTRLPVPIIKTPNSHSLSPKKKKNLFIVMNYYASTISLPKLNFRTKWSPELLRL